MDGAGGQHAGRGAKTVQRAAPGARQHFATDADLDAKVSGAGRPGDAHGLPDHSATRRLCADEARTFISQAREQPRPMGPAKPRGYSWAESRVFTKPWMSAASACDGGCPDLSTMKAFTISVRSASGLPTTAASATAGCRIRQSSISVGPMR